MGFGWVAVCTEAQRLSIGRGYSRAVKSKRSSGSNSVVECDLAKVEVAGSNPVSRSRFFCFQFARGPQTGFPPGALD